MGIVTRSLQFHKTIQYDRTTIRHRYGTLTCARTTKLNVSQFDLAHRTKNTEKLMKNKKQNPISSEEEVQSRVRGVSPGRGRESVAGKICERVDFKPEVKE